MVAISSSQKKTAFAVVLLALIAVGVMISGRGGFSGLRSDAFNNPSFVCTDASLMSGEVRYNGTTATLQNLSTEKAGLQTKIQGWNSDIRKNEVSIKKLEREKAAAEKKERALEVAVKKHCTPRALATCAAKKKELQYAKQDIRQAQNSLVSAKAKSNTLRTNIQSAESSVKLLEKQILEIQNFKADYETCKKALEKEKTEVSSFDLIVSGEVFVNEPFDITVRAMKSADTVNNKYEGKIFFDTNNNPADVVLPLQENDGGSEYQFQAADNGIKLFAKGLTLKKAGTYEIVVFELRGSNGGISKTVQIITKERTGNTVSCSSIAEASSCTRCFRFDLGGSNSANNIFVPRSSIPAGQQEYVDLAKSTISGTTYQGASVSPTGNITNNFDRFASGPNVTASWVWAKTKSGQGVVRGNIPTTVDPNKPVYGIRYTTVSHLKNQAAPNAVVPNTEATKVSCDFFFVKAASSVCGNGIKEGTEQCDDGNTNNNDSCDNNCKNTGSTISGEVGVGGKLTLSLDSSTPLSRLLLDNTSEHPLGVFRFTAGAEESLDVDSINIENWGLGKNGVKFYKFYDGSNLIATSIPDANGNVQLYLPDGVLIIPANDYKLITVKAVLYDINGATFSNEDTISIVAMGAKATGRSSGKTINSMSPNIEANVMLAFEAYPIVSFAADTSIGSAINLGSNQLIARIAITNPGNKDVTFQSGDGNNISIQLQIIGDDTDNGNETITLKDQDGMILDTGTITSATGLTQIDFNMSSVGATVGATIPAGGVKFFYIYADTSDLEDNDDIVQVWLDDDVTDVTFGINGTGAYAVGSVVNRGDIFGPILSRSF